MPKHSISLSISPLKLPSLKNHDPGSLCKKWGVRVSHVEKPSVLAKKSFLRQPGLSHSLVEIPRGIPAWRCVQTKTVDLLRQFFPVEPCDTEATNTEYPQRVFGAPRVKRFDERQVNYRKTVISKKCSCFLHLRERIFPES